MAGSELRCRRKKREAVAHALTRGGGSQPAGDGRGESEGNGNAPVADEEPTTAGSAEDFLRGESRNATEQDPFEVEVLEENWDAAQVFGRCRQAYVVGMKGLVALGFTAVEIEAGCRLAGVRRHRWPEVSDHVLAMGRIAATSINESCRK